MRIKRENLIKSRRPEERFYEGTLGNIWRFLDQGKTAKTLRHFEAGVILQKKKKFVFVYFPLGKENLSGFKNLLDFWFSLSMFKRHNRLP